MTCTRKTPHLRTTACLLLILAGSVDAADLTGKIELTDDRGRRPADVYRAVVYFTPNAPTAPPKPPAEPFEVATISKNFQPHVLAVPVGSSVSFPNQDRILHNAFSVSGKNRFDLGFYRVGESKETTFEAPGVVQVFCNVHHSMAAYVVVLDTPFYALPERSGEFRLTGLPEGPGTLTVWHERTNVFTQEILVPASAPLEIPLEITKKRVPRHKNKFGKSYPRRRRGKDY